MKALILVNGELYKPDILRDRIRAEKFDLVIAADAGARHAGTLGVAVDAVIGDLDSLSGPDMKAVGNASLIKYPAHKDETDLELALLYARERGADRIVMVGAMGGRMEMTIANVNLIAHPKLKSCRTEIWHGEQTGWLIRPPGEDISGNPGDTVSLVPLGGAALGVATEGMEYPLRVEDLPFGPARGISNVMGKKSARVTLTKGLLLAVHTPRQGPEKENGNMAEKRTRNVSVQVLPLVENAFPVVDKAIEVIQKSGLKYEVGPLETTMEGDDLDKLIDVAKAAHRACFAAGAGRVVTIIKIADALEGTTIEGKVSKFRGK